MGRVWGLGDSGWGGGNEWARREARTRGGAGLASGRGFADWSKQELKLTVQHIAESFAVYHVEMLLVPTGCPSHHCGRPQGRFGDGVFHSFSLSVLR